MSGSVREYLRLVKQWWWLLVVSAIIPMAISYYFTSKQPDLYQAKATIVVGSTVFQDPDPDLRDMNLSDILANAYAQLVKQRPVIQAVIERLGLKRSPEKLAAQISARVHPGAHLLEIGVTDTDPEAAALIANALADELIRRSPGSGSSDPEQQAFIREQLEELQTKIEDVSRQISDVTVSLSELTSAAEIQEAQDRIAALGGVKSSYQTTYANLLFVYRAESPNVLSLFDPAVPPQWPILKNTILIGAVAGAAGLGLALGAVFLMEYLDTSLRWEEGVQSILGLPVLGTVPQVSRKETRLSGNPLSPVAEGVRTMRVNIFLTQPDRSFKTLLLTSPSASEGKSFVLANLAVVLASAGSRVLVVDADMRRPSLHEVFDLPNVAGLADVLGDHRDGGEDSSSIPLQKTRFDNLVLLSAGRPPVDPVALLTSSRFQALLKSLRSGVDVVLIDAPPVLGPPDATVLATLAEGTILVASVGLTRRQSVQNAKERLLSQQGVNLLGLTINRAKLDGSYYYYGSDRGKEKSRWRRNGNGDGLWLTLGEAAERLGISKSMAREWCKSGRLPAVRKWLWWRIDRVGFGRMLEDTWEIKTRL